MGLLDNQTQQNYYNNSSFGGYQFTSLHDIINQFMAIYVGADKIIGKVKKTEVAFHAQRAMQELSFDTFKSVKSQETTLPPSLTLKLPQDYVNYTNISWVDSAGIEHRLLPTSKTSNPTPILQNSDGSYYSNLITNGDFNNGISSWQFWNVDGATSNASAGFDETQINWSIDTDGVLLTSNGLGNATSPKFQQAVNFEDGEEYTFTYNVTSVSANSLTGSDMKIMIYADGNVSYKTVDTVISTTGVATSTFIWDETTATTTKGWITIQLSGGNVNIKSISIKDIELYKTKNDGAYDLAPNGTIYSEEDSTAWNNFSTHTPNDNIDKYDDGTYDLTRGERYGINPENAQVNGSFYIDENMGLIHFGSNVSGKKIILKYISDGLGTDEEMKVHKFAEEAMYKWIFYAITCMRPGVPEYVIRRYQKEKTAAIRKAKLRLSNIKIEEITQILRGKSKWIKH